MFFVRQPSAKQRKGSNATLDLCAVRHKKEPQAEYTLGGWS
jgi:hypothetical protein